MRHQVAGRKLGKKTAHRLAMLRNMSASLIKHGRITTTLPKAKELRKVADKLVTLGKANSLHARRQAFDFLRNRDAVQKLFAEIAPAFAKRMGGYTRIYHMGSRAGDAAKMAIIEYLQEDILTAKVEGTIADDTKKKTAKKKVVKKAKTEAKEPKKEAKAEKKTVKKAPAKEKAPEKKAKVTTKKAPTKKAAEKKITEKKAQKTTSKVAKKTK
jgi:large subunit ribosomal protein L17